MGNVKGAAKDIAKANTNFAKEIGKWTAKKTIVLAIAASAGIAGINIANFTIAQLDELIKIGSKSGYHYVKGKVFVADKKKGHQSGAELKKQWKSFVEHLSGKNKIPLKYPYGTGAAGIAGLGAIRLRKWYKHSKK